MTCYPGFEGYLPDADMQPHGVVVDGNVITVEVRHTLLNSGWLFWNK
ncbi:MAG: hypothetical protein ACLTZT_12460 [Butyricimonas faecalis]